MTLYAVKLDKNFYLTTKNIPGSKQITFDYLISDDQIYSMNKQTKHSKMNNINDVVLTYQSINNDLFNEFVRRYYSDIIKYSGKEISTKKTKNKINLTDSDVAYINKELSNVDTLDITDDFWAKQQIKKQNK